MKKMIFLLVCTILIAGCQPAKVEPNAAPIVSSTVPEKSTVNLSKAPVQIYNARDVPVGSGIYRVFDPEAQVICYVYNYQLGGYPQATSTTYSGISCLPVSETNLK